MVLYEIVILRLADGYSTKWADRARRSYGSIIAVIFIVLLAFILLFKFLHKPKASDNVQVRYVQPQSFDIPTVPATPAA